MSSYAKKMVVTKAAPWISGSRVHQLFQPFYGGIGHILTFHRVIPTTKQPRIHNHLSLEITPEHLESTILFFKKRGYRFYSLDQVSEALKNGEQEKFVAFTFDDGYQDNFTFAYPILKKHGVPFTIYITNCFPNNTAILWWYHLENLLLKRDKLSFDGERKLYSYSLKTHQEKEHAFDEIRKLITQSFSRNKLPAMMQVIFGDDWKKLNLSMSWEEIRTISQDKLVTIGAHTMHHFPLRQLSSEDLFFEISQSKKELESNLGKVIEHFAYPFGKLPEATLREFEMVKKLGFKTATTTRVGNIFSNHKNHMECLPRISVNQATHSEVLQLQTSGFIPFIINKGKKIITN